MQQHQAMAARRLMMVAIALATTILAGAASAQGFGAGKPLQFVVPFAAGGASDTIARALAHRLSPELGQPVVVDNKPGANGVVGLAAVARALPETPTIGLGATATLALNPALAKLPYDPDKDLRAVAQIGTSKVVLLVHPGLGARTLETLIAAARAKPGALNYGSPGIGHSYHLMGELLKREAGIEMAHIPYKGDSPALQDLLAGRIQLMFAPLAAALPFIASGGVQPVALASTARSDKLPDVPTFAELGWKGFEEGSWFGIVAPGRAPDTAIARLDAAIAKALDDTGLRQTYAQLGVDVNYLPADKFSAFVAAETAKWARLVKAIDLKID